MTAEQHETAIAEAMDAAWQAKTVGEQDRADAAFVAAVEAAEEDGFTVQANVEDGVYVI